MERGIFLYRPAERTECVNKFSKPFDKLKSITLIKAGIPKKIRS